MANLSLSRVQKSFGSVQVIHDVNLEIASGEFVVFVGPSGCGKSTLLRLIAGLEDATSGKIMIGEQDVTHADPAHRGIAMVFQSYALYPHMTVAENMGFGLKMTGTPKAEVDKRVKNAADILHLGPLTDRRPKALSGGQRQRVAIGRAIVREPKVFLFDEPLSNLDAELRVQMRLEIARLHKELGATMIYVTHDQVEAMTLANKIVVLRGGNVEQVGAPVALYDDPDNMFVAGFIGSPKMNFLRATVAASEGQANATLPDYDHASVPLEMSADRIRAGAEISIGVRPEHFDPAGNVRFDTHVDVVENLGGTSFAYARDSETPLTIDLKSDRSVRQGERLTTGFHASNALVFDARSEARIRA